MNRINRVLFLNQMAGPLFRELAEDLSSYYPESSELFTGHPDTVNYINSRSKLNITKAPSYNRGSLSHRLLSWFSYAFFVFFKMLFAPKGTLLFVVSNPPLVGPLAFLICKLRKLQYVVLVYDMHPDTMISFGYLSENSLLVKLWRLINRKVWEGAHVVYTIGDVMSEKLSEQFDVTKTHSAYVGVIPPWADTDKIKPIPKSMNHLSIELGGEDCITVLYSGNMGVSHDIESMLKAALLLRNDNHIKFLFIGEGEKWKYAFDFQSKHHLHNVNVLPFQPEENLPFTMALGDISLVSLDKGAEGLMVPSKVYYYLAAGSAVIGVCQGDNDLKRTIEKSNAGITVEPGNEEGLAQAILSLANNKDKLNHFKQNARRSSVNLYSRRVCMNKLVTHFSTMNLLNKE